MAEEPNRTNDAESAEQAEQPGKVADQSLTGALRASFRLLTLILIIIVLAYLWTGITTVQPHEKGVVRIFGRIQRIAPHGLDINLPFPLGKVDRVHVSPQTVEVGDFWMYESPEDKTKPLHQRVAGGGALRPAWDGALMTGDRNLLHVRLACRYEVRDPAAGLFVSGDLNSLLRDLICRAAVQAAAIRTADGIARIEGNAFLDEIKTRVQEQFNSLAGGHDKVRIIEITMPQFSWPLAALPTFSDVTLAASNVVTMREDARGFANKQLGQMAGSNYAVLVGLPYGSSDRKRTALPGEDGIADDDLIGQYERAVENKDADLAAKLQIRIDEFLLGDQVSGEVSRIINSAGADLSRVFQSVKGRYSAYEKLLAVYRIAPDFLIQRLWADVYEDILNSPGIEKYFLLFNDGKTVLRINRDPAIARQRLRDIIREETAKPK
ncbi:MAG: hypothetical protein HZA50_00790 [Planctomycetes bacterium]|nr:hypothetical protein [Planctomycetota bacterium]